MNELKKIHKLASIKDHPEILIDKIPVVFHKDLFFFIYGSTLKKNKSGGICISRSDYFLWLKKIWSSGFDYPIHLNELR